MIPNKKTLKKIKNEVDNRIFRVEMTDGFKLEFFIADTNELKPYREKKELGIVVIDHETGEQIDGNLDEDSIDSLIDYLKQCKEHISDFNRENKK